MNRKLAALGFGHQQILQAVLVVVFVGQFQNRFADASRQPDDRFANRRFVPGDFFDEPRTLESRQLSGGGFVKIDRRVRVLLKKARGNRGTRSGSGTGRLIP